MKKVNVEIKFMEPILGSWNNNPEVTYDYVISKNSEGTDEDKAAEFAAIKRAVEDDDDEEKRESMKTVFPRDKNGQPICLDYQVRGFFKGAAGALRKIPNTKSSKIKAYKKLIDTGVFVSPKMIPLIMPEGEEITFCNRPIRASTPQGERICLGSGEQLPAGTTARFSVLLLDDNTLPLLEEWLTYGKLSGMGQWRSGGKGTFLVTSFEVEEANDVLDVYFA